jgi:hypothetical protein
LLIAIVAGGAFPFFFFPCAASLKSPINHIKIVVFPREPISGSFAMKKILCLSLPIVLLAAAIAAMASDFWEKKEYKEWSQKDCAKLLQDSPWAKKLELSSVSVMDNRSNQSSTDGMQPYIRYWIQFRSALPVRQAMVRQGQIANKYESLSPEQKQAFDKQAQAMLEGFPANFVVVYIRYETNDRNRDQELARYWQSKSTELLKNEVYLTGDKTKVPIAQFVVGQGAERWFQFVFPREVDGKPIITPEDKSIKLEFTYPAMGMGSGQAFQEFKTQKMIFNGNIAY